MKVPDRKYIKPFLLFVFIISVLLIIRSTSLVEKFQEVCENLECLGRWAPVGFIIIFIVAVILAIPGSALTAMGGIMFGTFYGVVYVSIAATIGATITFLISRYLARDYVHSKLSSSRTFIKLEEMTEKYGAYIVAIIRLIPIFPFAVVNYGFGLTRVHFGIYVIFSAICMIPGTILFVTGGDVVMQAFTKGTVPWKLVALIAVIAMVLFVLSRKYKSSIK